MSQPYQIEPVRVESLYEKWGLSACDYNYTDPDKITGLMTTKMVDFQDLMVKVSARRAAVVEGEITPMTIRMRSRNTYLSSLGQVLALLTKAQAAFTGDDAGSTSTTISGLTEDEYKLLRSLKPVADANMIWKSGSSYVSTKANLEGLVQAVKAEMDKENNASQTDMTRLQSLVDRRDDSYSTATNMMSEISGTRSTLIQAL